MLSRIPKPSTSFRSGLRPARSVDLKRLRDDVEDKLGLADGRTVDRDRAVAKPRLQIRNSSIVIARCVRPICGQFVANTCQVWQSNLPTFLNSIKRVNLVKLRYLMLHDVTRKIRQTRQTRIFLCFLFIFLFLSDEFDASNSSNSSNLSNSPHVSNLSNLSNFVENSTRFVSN